MSPISWIISNGWQKEFEIIKARMTGISLITKKYGTIQIGRRILHLFPRGSEKTYFIPAENCSMCY